MSEARSQSRIESELKARIAALETELKALEASLVSSRGRLAGRKKSRLAELRAENEAARARVEFLSQAACSLAVDALEPRDATEAEMQSERLKQALVAHCRKNNIDPELWKSIAS
ncbi:MAG TPA: hypothetical protein VM598_02155 [Bdellovibrionota bacterium]|nr:hypothetical protein [Bdellovibrionota bacterium]